MSTSTVIELFGWRLSRVFLIIIDLSIVEVHVQCIFCDIPKEKKTADRIRCGVYYWTLEESNVLRREYRRGNVIVEKSAEFYQTINRVLENEIISINLQLCE